MSVLHDVASEFTTTDPTELARQDRFLSYAALQMNLSLWGLKYDLGQAYLAAHMLKVDELGPSGQSTAVIEHKARNLQKKFADPMDTTPSALGMTSYGQQYLNLRGQILVGPIIAGAIR